MCLTYSYVLHWMSYPSIILLVLPYKVGSDAKASFELYTVVKSIFEFLHLFSTLHATDTLALSVFFTVNLILINQHAVDTFGNDVRPLAQPRATNGEEPESCWSWTFWQFGSWPGTGKYFKVHFINVSRTVLYNDLEGDVPVQVASRRNGVEGSRIHEGRTVEIKTRARTVVTCCEVTDTDRCCGLLFICSFNCLEICS